MKRYLVIVPILFLGVAFFGLAKVSEEIQLKRGQAVEEGAPPNKDQIQLENCAPDMPNVNPKANANPGGLTPIEVDSPVNSRPDTQPINEAPNITETILLNVPFASQAPFGDWKDERQQDGCEEASVIMAMLWAKGQKGVTRDYALSKILDISDFEAKNYDTFHDTGAKETLDRIIKDYFKYENAEVKYDVAKEDLISELANGNLIIAPMNGKALKNPNFTDGGPERHMLVIKGYDPVKKEFITNDPGTRKGEGYRYGEDLFYAAMRDYLCGYHVPITEMHKNIIVVKK